MLLCVSELSFRGRFSEFSKNLLFCCKYCPTRSIDCALGDSLISITQVLLHSGQVISENQKKRKEKIKVKLRNLRACERNDQIYQYFGVCKSFHVKIEFYSLRIYTTIDSFRITAVQPIFLANIVPVARMYNYFSLSFLYNRYSNIQNRMMLKVITKN